MTFDFSLITFINRDEVMRKKEIESGVIRFEIPIQDSLTTLTVEEIKKLQKLAKQSGLSLRRYVAVLLKKALQNETERPLKMFLF